MRQLPAINTQWFGTLHDMLRYDPSAPLQLPSAFMLVALLLFLAVYAPLKNSRGLRNLWTLSFSLYLYYKLSGLYVLLLVLIALSDYLIGRRISALRVRGDSKKASGTEGGPDGKSAASAKLTQPNPSTRSVRSNLPNQPARTALVALCVALNVALLLFFTANGVFSSFLNSISGGDISFKALAVPAGLSFFCFQSISYVVDCHRGRIEALKSFPDCLLLLSFFPKMFLGPLVDNSDFISQISRTSVSVSREDVGAASRMIFFGILKFCVLSKLIGQTFVNPFLSGASGNDGFTALMVIYAFTIRLYCDFSGYTDLATGIALLLGYRLPVNFLLPYHSATITEFWRRWHISLSTWLRDYLYIPLGGSRRGTARTYFNLLLTMLLGGLWHGFGLMFALWGLWHGLLLCLHKLWMKFVPGAVPLGCRMPLWRRLAGCFVTFNAVAFGWLLFASPSFTVLLTVLGDIFRNFSADAVPSVLSANAPAFLAVAVGYLMHCVPSSFVPKLDRAFTSVSIPGQAVLIGLAVWIALQVQAAFFQSAVSGLPIYANF